MVAFVNRRLQIFVSSTYKDLVMERQAAVEAILTAGHIPAGMELFTSGDESQMDVIKQWIDESDIYLLILGGRYGSIEPVSGKSYTHLEYEYAISQGKPFFSCVVNDKAQSQRIKDYGDLVFEMDEPKKLKEFRALVTGKIVKFWDDVKDIKIAVTEKMSHFERDVSLLGWVRPNIDLNLPLLSEEIARLSKENSQLRNQLLVDAQEEKILGLTFNQMTELLRKNDLLEYLNQKQYELNSTVGATYEDEDEEVKLQILMKFGLTQTNKYANYILTNEARAFLNKLHLFGVNSA